MRARYKCLLLVLLAVVVYLPGIRSGYFVFDDSSIVFSLQDDNWSFFDTFSRGSGTYWRPLIITSYRFDKLLWNLDPGLMHLENILLHAFNTLLVFASARLLAADHDHDLPLLIAALFCLHPINTEPVNWISGRTDPLAALFCLAGVYFLIRWHKDQRKTLFCYAAGLGFFIGCLAKEVAFGMFLGAGLFCLVALFDKVRGKDRNWRDFFTAILPFVLFSVLYIKARGFIFAVNDHGMEKVVAKTLDSPVLFQVQSFLIALGFYIKKLFIPTPLAFVIDQVSPHYLYLGSATLLLALLFLFLFRPHTGMFFIMLASISPALINAVHPIAWTPYAERYLYLPSALFVLSVCILIRLFHDTRRASQVLLGILLLYYLPVTVYRNLLWADQPAYLRLATEQAPDNAMLRNNYGVVLATFGEMEQARRELEIAGKLDPTNQLIKTNQQKYSAPTP